MPPSTFSMLPPPPPPTAEQAEEIERERMIEQIKQAFGARNVDEAAAPPSTPPGKL